MRYHNNEVVDSKFAFNDNPAGCKLMADGCSRRFDPINVWRDNELVVDRKQRWQRDDYDDVYIINCLQILKNKGVTDIGKEENVISFIKRHKDLIFEYNKGERGDDR